MSDVQETAALHHQTVTEFSRDQIQKFTKKSRRGSGKNGPIAFSRVHPVLWDDVQEIMRADESYTKVQIISEDTVILR